MVVAADARSAVEAVWRIESGRLIAGLVRMVRDVSLAEDVAQDALAEALEQWPASGVPRNPGAWLTAVAKRRAIDHWRRLENRERKYAEVAHRLGTESTFGEIDIEALDNPIDDDLLRLIFIACHPVLAQPAQVALTLRMLGGLSTEEIARAFLVSTPTIAQRIVRAKKTLSAANVPFEVPSRPEFPERLGSVLGAVYLIFNEGYSATAGEDWMRPALCQEALRLGRILAELVPGEAEAHALVALMEIQASRIGARTTAAGEPILLMDQDRSRWDQLLIRRGLVALRRAEALGGAPGSYALQAAIAACHARAADGADTDWPRIAALYGELARLTASPVVELNRAVALSMAEGPQAGLDVADALAAAGRLDGYHLLPAVRADLLVKLGRMQEACDEFERAAAQTDNERERALLTERAVEAARSAQAARS